MCEDEFEVKSLDHWPRHIGTVDDCRDFDFPQGGGTGLYLRSDRSDHQSTTRELAKDVQEPSASLVWGSGDWNGDTVTCESTSAGAVRQRRPHELCESTRSAGEPHGRCDPRSSRRCSRRYHRDCQWYGMFESTKSTQRRLARQTFPKESEGLKRRGEQFIEARKALEIPMEDVETIRGKRAREEVSFGSWTCSRKFRVKRKRVLCLGVSGAKRAKVRREIQQP